MKSKKFTIHNILSNNRFLLIVSVLLAIVFWAAVCISFSPETEVVIENVPIKIETINSVPEQYGLKMFGDNDYTVDITVSGSRYVVGGKLLSAEDFNVTASTSLVTSAGTHSLQVKVSKKNDNADYNIEAISEAFINVYFDEYAEKQSNLTVNADTGNIAPEGYIVDENLITDKKTVLVAGPALEIAQLDSVVAQLSVDEQQRDSKAYNVPMVALNKNGSALRFVTIDGEANSTVTVTVPVYKVEELPITVDFSNSPSKFVTEQPSFVAYPSTVNIATLQNGTDTDSLKIGTVDFSQLRPGVNTLSFNPKNIDGIKALDSTPSRVLVTVTIPSTDRREVSIPTKNISVANATEGYAITFDSNTIDNVIVYGTESEIHEVFNAATPVRIDLSSVTVKHGKNTVDVPLYLKDADGSWIYGEYTVSFTAKASN